MLDYSENYEYASVSTPDYVEFLFIQYLAATNRSQCIFCAVTAVRFLSCNALCIRLNICDACVVQIEISNNVDNELHFEEVVSCRNNSRTIGSQSVVC